MWVLVQEHSPFVSLEWPVTKNWPMSSFPSPEIVRSAKTSPRFTRCFCSSRNCESQSTARKGNPFHKVLVPDLMSSNSNAQVHRTYGCGHKSHHGLSSVPYQCKRSSPKNIQVSAPNAR